VPGFGEAATATMKFSELVEYTEMLEVQVVVLKHFPYKRQVYLRRGGAGPKMLLVRQEVLPKMEKDVEKLKKYYRPPVTKRELRRRIHEAHVLSHLRPQSPSPLAPRAAPSLFRVHRRGQSAPGPPTRPFVRRIPVGGSDDSR